MINSKNIIRYIFTFFAFIVLFASIYIYNQFKQTSQDMQDLNMQSNISYIEDIAHNIVNLIDKKTPDGIYSSLANNPKLIKKLEEFLQLFITNKYRYIYIVRKEANRQEFEFLLDGSKNRDDKSEFLEPYKPNNKQLWIDIYKTKKDIYFKDKEIKSLWLTYLKPIIKNGKVEAILAIDFSIKEQNFIKTSLDKLSKTLLLVIIFTILLSIVISIVSHIDKKRISLLEKQSKEIQNFNDTLQAKIKNEVEKNREKDKAMLQQSRLAQMGEMISMIAHQWRQPLTAISATSGNLTFKAKLNRLDNDTAVELGEKISSYSQHLSSTIDDFRDFFKPNKQIVNTTYTQLIQNVLSIVKNSLDTKNIKVKQNLKSEVTLSTYPNEIKQVILNLIKNAEDILLEKGIENPTITIETQDNILRVKDNAGGVPENIIEKVFDPYFSTKTQKDGTGLGLYMSKTIIKEHCGGELRVYNDKAGAVFEMKLPVKED